MRPDDLVTGEATDGFESRSRDEEEAIRARRRVADVDGEGPVIGLALSGGGIRSATRLIGGGGRCA